MVNENENNSTSSQSNTGSSASGSTFKDKSPEEVKDTVKETVAKGVAAVAGAIKGFADEAKKSDLAGSTKEAIQKAGETTREVAGTAQKEFQSTKQELKGSSGSSSTSGGSMGSSAGGSSLGGSSSGSSYGGSAQGRSSMGSTGTTPTNTGESSAANTIGKSEVRDMPDLRKTQIGKTDDDLANE